VYGQAKGTGPGGLPAIGEESLGTAVEQHLSSRLVGGRRRICAGHDPPPGGRPLRRHRARRDRCPRTIGRSSARALGAPREAGAVPPDTGRFAAGQARAVHGPRTRSRTAPRG
jgi:hypothetical protein